MAIDHRQLHDGRDKDIQLVVFDLMGTLVIDDGLVGRAYDRALTEAGLEPGSEQYLSTRSSVDALRGRPTLVVLTEVLGDAVAAEEATWAFDDSILEQVDAIEAIPGADATLRSVAGRNIATVVTTSFTAEVRKAVLARLGWEDVFVSSLSAHGTRRGHPAPDLHLEAMLELQIDSVAQMACVGDTVADLEAGNRAGAGLVVGVLTGTHDRATLSVAPHTHILDSVADLPELLADPRTEGHRRKTDRG